MSLKIAVLLENQDLYSLQDEFDLNLDSVKTQKDIWKFWLKMYKNGFIKDFKYIYGFNAARLSNSFLIFLKTHFKLIFDIFNRSYFERKAPGRRLRVKWRNYYIFAKWARNSSCCSRCKYSSPKINYYWR